MPTIVSDFEAAYLKLSAARQETIDRLAGTHLCHPSFVSTRQPCDRRKCRRDGVCSGTMRPSPHLIEQSRILRQHGLSSVRSTDLPPCLAVADDGLFAAYETYRRILNDEKPQGPEAFWPDFVVYLRYARRDQRRLGGTISSDAFDADGV
jgi:hypothetical protein